MKDLKKLAMNIVNQLFDEAEVPVKKRQEINDICDEFVLKILQDQYLNFCIDHKIGFSIEEINKFGIYQTTCGSTHYKDKLYDYEDLNENKKFYDNDFIKKKTKHKK